jgi:hypothetical protein
MIGSTIRSAWTFAFLSGLAILSCSSGGKGDAGLADGPADGTVDGRVDSGNDDGIGDGDSALVDGFILSVPAGARLCNFDGAANMVGLPLLKFQAALKAGEHVLPLDQELFAFDLIDEVIAQPAGELAQAQAAGQFRFYREVFGGANPDLCFYIFEQPYSIQAGEFFVTFGLWWVCEAAKRWVLGEHPDQLNPAGYLCGTLGQYTAGQVVATTAGGDRLEFDLRYHEGCEDWPMIGLCPMFYGDPIQGRFTRGAQGRTVDDYFRLALSCGHHMGPKTFVMVFDQPLDGIWGVLLDDLSEHAVRYLNADLSTMLSVPIATIEYP